MFSSAQLSIGNHGIRGICDFYSYSWRILCEFTFRPLYLSTDVHTYGSQFYAILKICNNVRLSWWTMSIFRQLATFAKSYDPAENFQQQFGAREVCRASHFTKDFPVTCALVCIVSQHNGGILEDWELIWYELKVNDISISRGRSSTLLNFENYSRDWNEKLLLCGY